MDLQSEAKEYTVSVKTNDVHKAVAQLGSALYDLLEQTLMTAEDEDEESDFNQFARETLNVLARYPEQICGDDSRPGETELERDDADASEID